MGILSKILGSNAANLIEKVGSTVDRFVTTGSEKEQLKQEMLKLVQDHELNLLNSGEKELELYIKDTVSARDSNVKIQDSERSSWLSKNVGYCLDIFFPISFGIVLALIFGKQVPEDNKEIFYMLVGLLGGYVSQIVGFHRGTSKSSENKQKQLDKMMNA